MKAAWILLLTVFAIVLAARFITRQTAHRNVTVAALPKYFASLMVQGTDGSLLFISIPRSPKFLQFVKHIDTTGERLAFSFPDAPWSEGYFNELSRRLKAEGIDYDIESTDRQDTRAFLTIKDIQCIEDAQAVVSAALEAMGENRSRKLSVHIEGGVSRDIYEKNKAKYESYFRAG